MKRFLREPLVHFLVLGTMIFGGYTLLNRGAAPAPERIVITQGHVAAMIEGFTRARHRPPTAEEVSGLIQDRIQEEVYYREAVALGLDRDDTVIRRRLRQKMEFISHDLAASGEPGDAELQAFLDAHAADFMAESRFSFRQVYLNPQRRGIDLASDAERMLARLRQAGPEVPVELAGDSLMMAPSLDRATTSEVASIFGEKFTAALREVPSGQWHGPVASGYGAHLVFVSERAGGGVPSLSEVRPAVLREWRNARSRAAADQFYQALLRKYAVSVEATPAPGSRPDSVAAR